MTPFLWKNCHADIAATTYPITVELFLNDVIVPAVRVLEEKIEALGRSDDAGDRFAQADMDEVRRSTMMAFSLSVQSLWERQLRTYLRGCAQQLRPGEGLDQRALTGTWDKIGPLFLELRGIALSEFPSYRDLDTLHLLGNACRHGDGRSAAELWDRCPDLWPRPVTSVLDNETPESGPPSVELMDVPLSHLRGFVVAIVTFWDDAEYIYCESIETKHSSLVARLEQLRVERSWRPLAVDEHRAPSGAGLRR